MKNTDILHKNIYEGRFASFDEFNQNEKLDALSSILNNEESFINIDSCLVDIAFNEFRKILYYFILSKSNPHYKTFIPSYFQDAIDKLMNHLEDDINYCIKKNNENTSASFQDDIGISFPI